MLPYMAIIIIVIICALAAVVVGITVCTLMRRSRFDNDGASGGSDKYDYTVRDPTQLARLREVRRINNMLAWGRAMEAHQQAGTQIGVRNPRGDRNQSTAVRLSQLSIRSLNAHDNVNEWFARQQDALQEAMIEGYWDRDHGQYDALRNSEVSLHGVPTHNASDSEGDDYGMPNSNAVNVFQPLPANKRWTQHGAPRRSMMGPQLVVTNPTEDASSASAYSR